MNKRFSLAALCVVFVVSVAMAQRSGHSGGSHGSFSGGQSFGSSHNLGSSHGFSGFGRSSFGFSRQTFGSSGSRGNYGANFSRQGFGGSSGFGNSQRFGGFGRQSFGTRSGFGNSGSTNSGFGGRSRFRNGTFGGGFTGRSGVSRSGSQGGFNFTGRRSSMRDGFNRGFGHSGEGRVHHFRGDFGGPWGDRWRFGYWGWPGWIDADWFFGFWLFSPFDQPCVVSPWYWYPCLPPYLPETQVTVVPGDSADWDAGQPYDYHSDETPLAYGNHELNAAVDQIRNVFDKGSTDAIDDLIPESGKVAIYNDGKYMYSLTGHQFREMMIDNVHATKTDAFDVTAVRGQGDVAIVHARHTFADPEGGMDTVYQSYRLRREGDRYVITDFMTSKDEHEDPF